MTEPVNVITLTEDDIVKRLRSAVATLTSRYDTLQEAVEAGLNYRLDPNAASAFEVLRDYTFLAGIRWRSCCDNHPDDLTVFLSDLEQVLTTGVVKH